jgi:hypothetical protein
MLLASARPKAVISPAAAAYFAIFGEAFRIVALRCASYLQ